MKKNDPPSRRVPRPRKTSGKASPFERPGVREAGVLLHVTSLPGPFGIGDLGPAAQAWVDRLADAHQAWWQILPLGPVGEERSPYQCFSAFAGNPLLISPEVLAADGLLDRRDLKPLTGAADRVDYAAVVAHKTELLRRAWTNYHQGGGGVPVTRALAAFKTKAAAWLDDYALFMALRTAHGGASWTQWAKSLVLREPAALELSREEHADEIAFEEFVQFLFERQLEALRAHARQRGVGLIGDLPIFVSSESSDVWTHQGLFELDRRRNPAAVAGVPPDHFSKDGQRWGNPLYDWPAMAADGYAWWVARLQAAFDQADLVRLDHFRGFDAYWRVPANAPTAATGRWVKGPGDAMFDVAREKLGRLPLIAEDLGLITPSVVALRERQRFPGMRIIQFGFGGWAESPHLPHEFVRDCVAYPGTHDNDTTLGWFRTLDHAAKTQWLAYTAGCGKDEPAWTAIRLAWSSVAALAITPMQDVLALPTSARMNMPGVASGNWRWRLANARAAGKGMDRLRQMTETYGRVSTDSV